MPNKVLKLAGQFELKSIEKSSEGEEDILKVSGYATTNDPDRHGDIVDSKAWKGGIQNYKNNPIVLAHHRHDMPIGRCIEVEHDEKGLRVTAQISKAAGNMYDLIKEGILKTFSVGFIAKDGKYDNDTDIFVITKAELIEVSVVSVPANPYAGFSVMKNFDKPQEFENFLKEFDIDIPKEENILMPEVNKDAGKTPEVDINLIAKQAAAEAAKAVREQLAAEAKEKEEKEAAEKAAKDKMQIEVKSGIELALADVTKAYEEKLQANSAALEEAKKALSANQEEVMAMLRAKGTDRAIFDQKDTAGLTSYEKQAAVLLALAKNKSIRDTKYFADLREKSGMEHFDTDAATNAWEEEFNTTVHNEMVENLVVEPLFTSMPMNAKTVNIPVNPDAGEAEWIDESAYRSSNGSSTGTAVDHKLSDNSITAYKLASKEFIGYEEEEDTILTLMPIIRSAIARRMAKSTDKALLRGVGGTTVDPISGLATLAIASGVELVGGASWTGAFDDSGDGYGKFLSGRKALGIYGDDPSGLVFLVSPEAYYEILNWEKFQTVDKIGLDRASLRTGQVGAVGAVPVVMSRMFDSTAIAAGTVGTPVAILARPSNFVVGNLRSTMTESDRDVINQKNVIVSTRRLGFQAMDVGRGAVNFEIAS